MSACERGNMKSTMTETFIRKLEHPEGKIDMVLDTDAYNEIDDQFAIAYMLRNGDKLNVKAIYAAPFLNEKSTSPKDGMEKSYGEILKVVELAGCSDMGIDVCKGSESYLPDERTPVKSDAAEHLARLASKYSPEKPLYVAAIGAITNVASAILTAPDIVDKIVIVWLGGNAHHFDASDFNLFQDVAAARVVFGCGAAFVQLPCKGVVSAFTISEAELEKWLLGQSELCDYLARSTIEEASAYAAGTPWTRVIWDVTAIAWLVSGRFFGEQLEKSPIPEYDGHYAFDASRHFIKYVTYVDRDALVEDLFTKLRG